tara:strand:- start:172 stop:405 length:234 start_codon:yes stop_codon:yes gene_type:complete
MIILEVVLRAYMAITFTSLADEVWNINNPRPYPKKTYVMMQWEEDDFYKLRDGSYRLRPKRKVDSKLKKYARQKGLD